MALLQLERIARCGVLIERSLVTHSSDENPFRGGQRVGYHIDVGPNPAAAEDRASGVGMENRARIDLDVLAALRRNHLFFLFCFVARDTLNRPATRRVPARSR